MAITACKLPPSNGFVAIAIWSNLTQCDRVMSRSWSSPVATPLRCRMAERATTHTSITGYGVWHPDTVLDNAELCIAFNEFVRRDNAKHADAIAAGTREALRESSPEFIV